jgi:peptidyl-prolyl cis-trans isomerase SurA
MEWWVFKGCRSFGAKPLKGGLWLLGIVASATMVSQPALAEETVLVDRIVAVVNDEIISLYDLNQKFEPYANNIKSLRYSAEKERQMLFKVRSDLLGNLVDAKLTDQEIKKNKLVVTEAEIDNTIERLKSVRSFTDEDIRAGLAEQGMTMEDYRKEIKEQLLRARLVTLEVKSKIVITDENVQDYYDRHIEKYRGEEKFHLWNIYIAISGAGDSGKRSAYQRMESILSKLNQGAPFEKLVNDDFTSSLKAKGGDLGMFLVKELSPQLQSIVKNMKAGEFSSIIETNSVYQILYVEKIIKSPSRSVEEVRREIEDILFKDLVDDKYQDWLEDLRKRSHIKIIQ